MSPKGNENYPKAPYTPLAQQSAYGKPNRPCSVRLPEEIRLKLEAAAKLHGRKLSEHISLVLTESLKASTGKEDAEQKHRLEIAQTFANIERRLDAAAAKVGSAAGFLERFPGAFQAASEGERNRLFKLLTEKNEEGYRKALSRVADELRDAASVIRRTSDKLINARRDEINLQLILHWLGTTLCSLVAALLLTCFILQTLPWNLRRLVYHCYLFQSQ